MFSGSETLEAISNEGGLFVGRAGVAYDGNGIDVAMARMLEDSSLAAEVADLPQHTEQLAAWLKASL